MKRRIFATALTVSACATTANAFDLPRLEVSENGRFLVTENGEPFFWLADTAWRMTRLNAPQIITYLQDRASKNFNVIQGPVLVASSPSAYGQSNPDPDAPNLSWFGYFDFMVAAAESNGLYIAPVLIWGDQYGRFENEEEAYAYGCFLGTRYQTWNNIIWIVAGEYGHPQIQQDIWRAVAAGLEDAAQGAHLITIHPRGYSDFNGSNPNQQSSSWIFHDDEWLSFNMIQSAQSGNGGPGAANWEMVEWDYNLPNPKPTLDSEPNYERLGNWPELHVRRRAYWSVFAGGFGHTYGANGVWQMTRPGETGPGFPWSPQDTWDVAISYPGSSQMQHLRALMESRPYLSRIPGQDVLVTTNDSVHEHYHATRNDDGAYAMIYIPEGDETIQADLDVLGGDQFRTWWYSPADGTATQGGDIDGAGVQSFTTPPGDDWVFVIDRMPNSFPPPGQTVSFDPADINQDHVVDVQDLLLVIRNWGSNPGHPADVNDDEVVDTFDLTFVLERWTQ